MEITVNPEFRDFLKSWPKSPSLGNLIQDLFKEASILEMKMKNEIDLIKLRTTDLLLHEGLLKSEMSRRIGNPVTWVRIQSKGVSQRTIDFIRNFFPGIIPGHTRLQNTKVRPNL